jgi:hypothetical protein
VQVLVAEATGGGWLQDNFTKFHACNVINIKHYLLRMPSSNPECEIIHQVPLAVVLYHLKCRHEIAV